MKHCLARHRWAVFSRVIAATAGAYGLAALASSAFALLLPRFCGVSRADGVMLATLLSFALYAGTALWVLAARSAWRAWAGMVLGSVAAILLQLALQGGGGR